MAAKRKRDNSGTGKKITLKKPPQWLQEGNAALMFLREQDIFKKDKPAYWGWAVDALLRHSSEIPTTEAVPFVQFLARREKRSAMEVKYLRCAIGRALNRLRDEKKSGRTWTQWYRDQKFGLPLSDAYLFMDFAEHCTYKELHSLESYWTISQRVQERKRLLKWKSDRQPKPEEGSNSGSEGQPKPESDPPPKPESDPKPEEGSDSGSEGQPEPDPKPVSDPKPKSLPPVNYSVHAGISRLYQQATAVRDEIAAAKDRGEQIDRIQDCIDMAADFWEEVEAIRIELTEMAEAQGLEVQPPVPSA